MERFDRRSAGRYLAPERVERRARTPAPGCPDSPIALQTETAASERSEPEASLQADTAIQHFTVADGDVRGRALFEAGPGTRAFEGTAQLTLDGVRYDGIGAHVYPNTLGDPFDFTYTGLTACPPGLD